MCDHTEEYNEFPPRTIGGPTGDYEIMADVTSASWLEYSIISTAGGDAGPYTVVVSGTQKPFLLSFTGAQTFGSAAVSSIGNPIIDGTVLHSSGISSVPLTGRWLRVANQQRKVFARIDTPANSSAFVTIQFRARILQKIPKPFVTVQPHEEQQMNAERER